MYSLPCYT